MLVSIVSLFSIPLLLNSLASALDLDCSHIRSDGIKFDFHELGGPHSVSVIDKNRPPSVHNSTWTIDICKPLEKIKGVDSSDQCQTGTYVCGIVTSYNPVDDPDQEKVMIENVISVAGNFHTTDGKVLEPKYERLKKGDSDKEGLTIELHGGTYNKKNQMAIVEFQCDKDRTGNEGATSKLARRAENGDDQVDDKNSLSFVSYGPEDGKDDTDVLRMNWKTKFACEDAVEGNGEKGGWGFFTWLIVLLFLGIAAYLIFGSWLNYNRYGARGWDLLPHGDTIRDIPYLFKDWSKKVVDSVSGGGSRGGYSAV